MKALELDTGELRTAADRLRVRDRVLLSGTIYTARDAAHKRMTAMLEAGEQLPFALEGAVIYYAGPTRAPEGMPIGSCGPTTSSRMDVFTPLFLDRGLCGMIGKGERSAAVREAIVRNGAVYFCAIGGAGALACRAIRSCEIIAFPELGCESVKRLEIVKFPLIVGIDSRGQDIFTGDGLRREAI